MKLTEKHFELFKSECLKWIDRFELNNWGVEFFHKKLEKERHAQLDYNWKGQSAAISLTTDFGHKIGCSDKIIKESAKHEVIHLLVTDLSEMGWERCIQRDALFRTEEALVRKLEKIIQ